MEDYGVMNMKLRFEIKQVHLLVLKNEEQKLFDFETDNLKVQVVQSPGSMTVDLKLDAIESRDYIYEYKNPNLRMLMTSVPPDVNPDETDEDLMEIQVHMLEKHHPDYNKKRTNVGVQLKLGYFFLNYKPGTIQEIMKFFIPNAGEAAVEEKLQEEKQEVVFTNSDAEEILVDLNISMSVIGVRLIHKTSYVCMAELALSGTKLEIQMKALEMKVKGKFEDLQLFDMTNYPDTLDSNIEHEKVKPYELFGAAEGSEGGLMDLMFVKYDVKHPKADLKNNIYSFVEIKIRGIKINYLQQPILRILDYLTGQLLPTLSPGGAVVVKLTKEMARENILKPQFMDLNVQIESPLIMLKPRPDSKVFLELRLGDIKVGSERVKDKERLQDEEEKIESVYCERYLIKLGDMGISKVRIVGEKEIKTAITRQIEFGLSFEKVCFVDEYNLLVKEKGKKVDISMKLEGKMSPMILSLKSKDYRLIMKCLNFNISYDDLNDQMFVSDYAMLLANQAEPGGKGFY